MDDPESNGLDTPLVQVESGSHQATPVVETHTFLPEPSTVKVCNQTANIQRVDSSLIAEVSVGAASEDTILLSNEQKSLHSALPLPGEMTRLCQILKLSEDVSDVVRKFLEYVMKNHRVIYDPPSIVQALQLSVCWVAASITKQKVNKHDTLVLAEQLLNYQCTKEQVKSVYAKLRSIKIKYLQSVDNVINLDRDCMTAEGQIAEQNRSLTENTSTSENDENIQRAQSKCEKRMKKLTRKHQQEIQKFEELWESKRKEPEKDLDSAVIRSTHSQNPNWFVKLKPLKDRFSKKMEEHNLIKQAQLKELKAKQLCAMNELRKEADLLKGFKGQQLHSQSDDNVGCPQNEATATAEPSNQSKCPSDAVCSILSAPVVQIFEDIQSAGPSKEHGCPRELSNSSNKECDEAGKTVMCNDFLSQVGRSDSGGLHSTGQTSLASEQILALPDCQVPNDNIEQSLGSALQQASDAPVAENQSTLGRSDSVTCMTSMTDEIATPLPSSRDRSLLGVSISGNPSPTTENHDQVKSSEHGGAEVLYPESISIDVSAVENQSSSQIEATTSKPMDTVTSEPLVDASVGCNQAPASENLYQGGSSSQTVEHGVGEVFSHVPRQENLEIRLNNLDIGQSTDAAHGYSLESSAALQIDVGTLQPLVNQSEQSNQVFQLGVNAGNIHPTRIVSSTNSTPFLSTDPLQYQLEGIQKETEQLGLTHADMMTQLLSDRDKVIEELHKKYEVKIQEIEAEFQLKRNELDKKMNKVLMNKMVAEAFRSKSLEDLRPRPAGHPVFVGIQSVAPPSVSVQPTVGLHSIPPFRPSFVNTASPWSGRSIGANELRPCRSPSISLTQHVVPPPFRPMVINTIPLSIPSSIPMVSNIIPPAWGPLSIPLTRPVVPRPSRVQTRGGYWVTY